MIKTNMDITMIFILTTDEYFNLLIDELLPVAKSHYGPNHKKYIHFCNVLDYRLRRTLAGIGKLPEVDCENDALLFKNLYEIKPKIRYNLYRLFYEGYITDAPLYFWDNVTEPRINYAFHREVYLTSKGLFNWITYEEYVVTQWKQLANTMLYEDYRDNYSWTILNYMLGTAVFGFVATGVIQRYPWLTEKMAKVAFKVMEALNHIDKEDYYWWDW